MIAARSSALVARPVAGLALNLPKNGEVEKRAGRDGKSRKMPKVAAKAKRMATPKLDRRGRSFAR